MKEVESIENPVAFPWYKNQSNYEGAWVRFPNVPGSFCRGNFVDFPLNSLSYNTHYTKAKMATFTKKAGVMIIENIMPRRRALTNFRGATKPVRRTTLFFLEAGQACFRRRETFLHNLKKLSPDAKLDTLPPEPRILSPEAEKVFLEAGKASYRNWKSFLHKLKKLPL